MATQTDLLQCYLKSLPESTRKEFDLWFDSRSDIIKAMVVRFPPGTRVMDPSGVWRWVVSYQEVDDGPPMLGVSEISPYVNYDLAMEGRVYLCCDHIRKVEYGHGT